MGTETGISRQPYPGNENILVENVPPPTAELQQKLQSYNNMRGAGFADFTADGRLLVYRRVLNPGEGVNAVQIHLTDQPGAEPTQITKTAEPIDGADGRPGHADQFLSSMDTGGDENYQIYLFDRDEEHPRALSEPGTRNVGAFWSHDGKAVVWDKVVNGGKDYDVMMADPENPDSRQTVFHGEGAVFAQALSRDKSHIIIAKSKSNAESTLHLLDIKTGQLTDINPSTKKIRYGGTEFSVDGKSLFVTSNEHSDFSQLIKINLRTGKQEVLTSHIPWNVETFALSPGGRYLAYSVNANGTSELRVRDMWTGKERKADLPHGILGGLTFDETGKTLGFSLNAAKSGGNAYTMKVSDLKAVPWVETDYAGLDPAKFVEPELITYPSNGMYIPAYVYRPKHLKSGEKSPVIIDIHGGPESQARPYFDKDYQYWVQELGATVIVPNVRGSDGYGKAYLDMDNGFKRKESVKDIGGLLDWIETQPGMDKDRVAVNGVSYGGYMVLASLVDYEDRLVGGVDGVGISHFGTFLQNTSEYRRANRAAEYGDPAIPGMAEFHEQISPLNNAHKIKDPLFVVQGANDPRVPMSEAEQIVSAVRKNGQDVWYMLGKNEGHGFQKRENVIAEREAKIQFFRKIFGLATE